MGMRTLRLPLALLLHDTPALQAWSHGCSGTPPCRPCWASSSVFSATYFGAGFTIPTSCRPRCERQSESVKNRILFGLVLTSSLSVAWAHSSGHGPDVKEAGPNGGKLSSVVSAKEADKGKEAKQMYLAEVQSVLEMETTVRVLSKNKIQISEGLSPKAKVIALNGEAKPDIFEADLKDSSAYRVKFPKPSKSYTGVEIIFNVGKERVVATIF